MKPMMTSLLVLGLFLQGQQSLAKTQPQYDAGKCSTSNGQLNVAGYDLKIVSINISHGDATLIVLPDRSTILVDTGQHFAVKDYLMPFLAKHGVERIDHFIVTHYDGDHAAGLLFEQNQHKLGYYYDRHSTRLVVTGSPSSSASPITNCSSLSDSAPRNP